MSGLPKHSSVRREGTGIYVGYLAVPRAMRARVFLVLAICVVWFLGVSGVLAISMRDPGAALWDTSAQREWEGTLVMDPYPMLVTRDDALLVVGMGKFGVHSRLRDLDGARVKLSGYELRRSGRRMIELALEEGAVTIVATENTTEPFLPSESEPFEMLGEIVDGKCFMGAMKPGDGVGHRSCAVLCIQGGLPPMFAYEESGVVRFALLSIDGQSVLDESSLGFVAQSVRISGQIRNVPGLSIIEVDWIKAPD